MKKMDEDGFNVNFWIENEGCMCMYVILYSEYLSYIELWEFIKFLKSKKIISTVNAITFKDREKLVNKYFLDLVDLK